MWACCASGNVSVDWVSRMLLAVSAKTSSLPNECGVLEEQKERPEEENLKHRDQESCNRIARSKQSATQNACPQRQEGEGIL